jgi:hypothetical protein
MTEVEQHPESIRRMLTAGPQDRLQQKHDSDRVKLLVPVIVLVLGTTAITAELRPFDLATLSLGCNARDLVVNVWVLPLLSLAGGASVAFSVVRVSQRPGSAKS